MTMFKKTSNLIAIVLVAATTFYAGYYFGARGFEVGVKKNPPQIVISNKEPKDQNVDFKIFWTVWSVLNDKHIDRPLNAQKLIYGAVSGMVNAVGDDYTAFFTPDQNKIAKSSLNGSYEGIGAELGFKDRQLIVVSPLDGSPAQAAGVRPGDKILEIEGVSTLGMSLSDAVSKIRGVAGTVSTLKMQHGDEDPKVVKITRNKIVSKSVDWKDLGDGIVRIRITRFGDNTNMELSDSVRAIKKEVPNLKGIVLDLRENPGGYLESAVYVASEFMAKGTVLVVQNADGTKKEESVNRQGQLTTVPLVVLIDKGSASASEIVAGALKDSGRAKLVGVTSFGKGTIQSTQDFDDSSSLHVTIAKWLTPKGIWVHKVGLTPEVVVERSEDDILNGRDPQIDKAKEVLINAK